ncbi:MAG: FAD:protein FMN transferase [Planctomycetaceae bacterium]|nr:FAD:protein FMN transferase [Planctomycetaceae bacterium]
MGVPFRLVVYATDQRAANKALDAAFKRISDLNDIYSDYDPNSELSRLSRSSGTGEKVSISHELFDILRISERISRQSQGAFDVTVGPYVRLWRRARRQKQLPDTERMAEAKAAVGYQYIRMDAKQQSVELLRENMRLDLGGIAKGYAADEAMRVLREHGIESALIDASGDLLLSDPPPGESSWTIGIAALKSPEGEPTEYLKVANLAVATSGDAYRYVEIDGTRYSHIVDPQTGKGLTTQSSVTVVAPTATLADAWASAVSVLGPGRGLRVLAARDKISALITTRQENQTRTVRSCDFPKTVKTIQQP